MSSTSNPVPRIYRAVIDDVIKNVRESFLNEGVDEQVLQELKQLWESKLLQSRAIDYMPADVNVPVSLTYPHRLAQAQTTSEAGAGPSIQVGQPQQQNHATPQMSATQPGAVHPAQIVQNSSGQFVYVSHPTLGNVGQMTGAAAQAAMALQDNATVSANLVQQNMGVQQIAGLQRAHTLTQAHNQVHGLAQAQVIQVQQGNPQHGQPNAMFQPNRIAPRLIYTQQPQGQVKQPVIQVDGANGSSSEDELDDDEDYDNYPVAPVSREDGDDPAEEEEPLNSEDDVSDEDQTDFFDTDNVVVCQYDKIARTRNRWKFHLKDGIMNLRSKDYVFHKANGDSEW